MPFGHQLSDLNVSATVAHPTVRGRTCYFRSPLQGASTSVIVAAQAQPSSHPPKVSGARADPNDDRGRQLGERLTHSFWRKQKDWARSMSVPHPSTPVAASPEVPDEVRRVGLETLIARLVAQQVAGQIGYWANFSDDRGVSHYAFTTDPAYANLSVENAVSRTRAVDAFGRAIERYRGSLAGLRPGPRVTLRDGLPANEAS